MTETLLIILAIELGAIFLAMVGIFALETYALFLRGKEKKGMGNLRLLTPEELTAYGLDHKDCLPPAKVDPVAANMGQYL